MGLVCVSHKERRQVGGLDAHQWNFNGKGRWTAAAQGGYNLFHIFTFSPSVFGFFLVLRFFLNYDEILVKSHRLSRSKFGCFH